MSDSSEIGRVTSSDPFIKDPGYFLVHFLRFLLQRRNVENFQGSDYGSAESPVEKDLLMGLATWPSSPNEIICNMRIWESFVKQTKPLTRSRIPLYPTNKTVTPSSLWAQNLAKEGRRTNRRTWRERIYKNKCFYVVFRPLFFRKASPYKHELSKI